MTSTMTGTLSGQPSGMVSGMATAKALKRRENRLRDTAKRQGLFLTKSSRRDRRAIDYGTYGLTDLITSRLVFGDQNFGWGKSLDQIEEYLNTPPAERR